MGRPYGVGFYGTHRYSRGSYVRLASVAQAAAEAQANAVRVRETWTEAPAAGAACAVQPDALADRAAFLRGGASAAAGAGSTLDRVPSAVEASSKAWTGPDRIRTFRAGARAIAATIARPEAMLGPAALLNATGTGYAEQPDIVTDRGAFSRARSAASTGPLKLTLVLVYEPSVVASTAQAESDVFSAAQIPLRAQAYAMGRFAWELDGATEAEWEPDEAAETIWAQQGAPPVDWTER